MGIADSRDGLLLALMLCGGCGGDAWRPSQDMTGVPQDMIAPEDMAPAGAPSPRAAPPPALCAWAFDKGAAAGPPKHVAGQLAGPLTSPTANLGGGSIYTPNVATCLFPTPVDTGVFALAVNASGTEAGDIIAIKMDRSCGHDLDTMLPSNGSATGPCSLDVHLPGGCNTKWVGTVHWDDYPNWSTTINMHCSGSAFPSFVGTISGHK